MKLISWKHDSDHLLYDSDSDHLLPLTILEFVDGHINKAEPDINFGPHLLEYSQPDH